MRYFNLFSNILPTKGYTRMLISDLGRDVSSLFPLELYDLIEELKSTSIEEVFQQYDEESKTIVQEYLDLLLEKEYGFITQGDWDRSFPPLYYGYQDYNSLSNIFMELDELILSSELRQSIEKLEIRHLVIYCRNQILLEDFLKFDALFKHSVLEGIEIFSPFHGDIDENFIQHLNEKTSRIYNLIFYKCEKTPFKVRDVFRFKLIFSEQDLKINSCGKVNIDDFDTNITKVLEAINHNSCLHKKIGIDIDGNIRNCPAMPQSFGNIRDTTLEEALNHKGFKKYWDLSKDQIEGCKDCEFRNVCTDCRAYTEQTHLNESGLDTSKPLKCGYNPYTSEWEEWGTNPHKQKAIKNYGMQELVKNNEA